jgi:hypothetical protein
MTKLIIVLCLIPLLGISQTKDVVTTNSYIPENGKIVELENALASLAQKYHAGDWSWRVYDVLGGSDAGDVSKKLLYSFLKVFPLAENVKCSEDTKGYFLSFTQLGILSKVAYNPQGDFIYALRYYKEENLPVFVLLRVREKFADKKIFGVTELSTPGNITYHLKLEDTKSWYSIQVTTLGDVTIEEHFKK